MPSIKKAVSPGTPVQWSDVEEMYEGSPDLLAALKGLLPLSDDEAVALVASHLTITASGIEMLPATDEECVTIRAGAIRRASADALATNPGRPPRDTIDGLYQLVVATGSDDPLTAAAEGNWLWGPAAPPLQTQRRIPKRSSMRDRWRLHALEANRQLTDAAVEAFETAGDARIEAEAASGDSEVARMQETSAIANEASTAIMAAEESLAPASSVSTLAALGASNGDPAAARQSAAAWEAARTLRNCALSTMIAARSVYLRNAGRLPDPERRALEAIRAMGWVDAVVERWLALCPQDSGRLYSEVSPTGGDFWAAALVVARSQVGFANEGMHGLAKMLANRV